MKYILKHLLVISLVLYSSSSILCAHDDALLNTSYSLQVTQQRIDEHEQALRKLVYNRHVKRYALYTALSGVAAYTLYYFLSDHDITFFPNSENKQYITKEQLHESQKQLCKDLIEHYGLTKKVSDVPAENKTAVITDMFWSFAGKLKNSSISIAQFGLASILLTKAEGIFFSNESIDWFYTENAIFEKAQNCSNWAGVYDGDIRPDCTRTCSAKNLNKQFFYQAAHDYIDSLMALVGFMNYKVKSLEKRTDKVYPLSSFTSIIEAVTLYATELALKLEERTTGNSTMSLQDEVRKTDRLIESLYKKFLMLEKKYS